MPEQYIRNLGPYLETYTGPAAVIVAGLLLGILFERVILRMFLRMAEKTKWKGDDVFFRSFRGIIFIWITCTAVYYAGLMIPLGGEQLIMLERVLTLAVVLTLTVLASRASVALIHMHSMRVKGIFASTSIFSNITKAGIFIVGSLIALQTVGITITPILGALGVGGLAVALALQDSLSNLFAGLHLIASSRIKPGDFVRLENGEQGFIEDITWRNTNIRALSKYLIIVPNSKLASSMVLNYSQTGKELTVMAEVTVSYYNDLEKVEKVTIEVANEVMKEVPGGVPEFTPHVRFNIFADTNIKMNVMMRGKKFVDQYLLKHEFLKKLHARYVKEGISFTSAPKPPL